MFIRRLICLLALLTTLFALVSPTLASVESCQVSACSVPADRVDGGEEPSAAFDSDDLAHLVQSDLAPVPLICVWRPVGALDYLELHLQPGLRPPNSSQSA